MPLTTTANVLTALNLSSDPTGRIDLLRRSAERAIISYCKWPIIGQTQETRYYDGVGYRDIVLQPYTSKIYSVYLDPQGNYGTTTNSFATSTLLVAGLDYSLVFEGAGVGPGGQVGRSGLLRKLQNNVYWFPSDLIYYRGAGGLAYRWPAFWPAGYGNIKVNASWGFPTGVAISAAAWNTGTATFTTSTPHGLWSGLEIAISGVNPAVSPTSVWNGNEFQVVGVVDDFNFTVSIPSTPESYVSGGTVDAIPYDIKLAVYELVGMARSRVQVGGIVSSESLPDYNYSISLDRRFQEWLGPYRSTPAAGLAG